MYKKSPKSKTTTSNHHRLTVISGPCRRDCEEKMLLKTKTATSTMKSRMAVSPCRHDCEEDAVEVEDRHL